jgi:hypothetical protein
MQENVYFTRQIHVLLLLLFLFVYGLPIALGLRPVPDLSTPWQLLGTVLDFALVCGLMGGFLWFYHIETTVTGDGITIRPSLYPKSELELSGEEIAAVEVTEISPRNWRSDPGFDTVYACPHDSLFDPIEGVAIERDNGETIFVASSQPEPLCAAVQRIPVTR